MGFFTDMLARFSAASTGVNPTSAPPKAAPVAAPQAPVAAPQAPPAAPTGAPVGDTYQTYLKLLTAREGLRLAVYPDSRGKATVGVGHLVLPQDGLHMGDTITQAQANAFLAHDALAAYGAARAQMKEAGITDERFAPWLGSVNFQLGTGWTKTFRNTWAMIVRGDYEKAANALYASDWDQQTPHRVDDFAAALRALPPKAR